MSIKIRRTVALVVGQGLLVAFVLWAAQIAPANAGRKTSFDIFNFFSYYSECVNAVCDAGEVEELYKEYKSEIVASQNPSPTELINLAGGLQYAGFMVEAFMGAGYTIRTDDLYDFDGIKARNPAAVWTYDGSGLQTGMMHQFTLPANADGMIDLGVLIKKANSFELGRSVWAIYGTAAEANAAALGWAQPGELQSLQLVRNVIVNPIYENQFTVGGSATNVIGWSATAMIGSANIDTFQESRTCAVKSESECATRPKQNCNDSLKFPAAEATWAMRPIFQSNTACLADPATCSPWASNRPAEILVNANYFKACRDYYCASCAAIAGLSISRNGSLSPDSTDTNGTTPLDALLIYGSPPHVDSGGRFFSNTEHAEIVPHVSLPSDLSNVTAAVAGTLLVSDWQIVNPCDNCHEGDTAEPRTAVGIRPNAIPQVSGVPLTCYSGNPGGVDNLVIVVIQPGVAPPGTTQTTTGVTASALANYMLTNFCTQDVLMLDGGGSSQFASYPPFNPYLINGGTPPAPALTNAGDRKGFRPVPNALVVNPYPLYVPNTPSRKLP